MDNNIWIKSSATLAKRLHKDQVDKAGVDYFEGHLCMVASMGKRGKNKWSVIFMTPVKILLIQSKRFFLYEAQQRLSKEDRLEFSSALHLLNHHNSPDRDSYIRAIGEHPLARAVKLNDLRHNMDLSRLPSPSSKDFIRRERYEREYNYLYSISSL